MKDFASSCSTTQKQQIQTIIDFTNNNTKYVQAKARLDSAIANFIHSLGHSFRIVEAESFKHMIEVVTQSASNQ